MALIGFFALCLIGMYFVGGGVILLTMSAAFGENNRAVGVVFIGIGSLIWYAAMSNVPFTISMN